MTVSLKANAAGTQGEILLNGSTVQTFNQNTLQVSGNVLAGAAQSSDPAALTRKDYVDNIPVGNFPVGGNAALNTSWTKLPIYNGYSYGMTFQTDSVRIDKSGTYLITFNMSTDATGDAQIVGVFRNGTVLKEIQNTVDGFNNSMGSAFMVYLAVNDVVDLRGIRGSTACNYVGGKTSMEIAFIRP